MNNNFIFRKAKIQDLKDVLRLNLELFKKEYREFDKTLDLNWTFAGGAKFFKNEIIKNYAFVELVEKNKRPVGYLSGHLKKAIPYHKKAKYAELGSIFVAKRFRNMGLGKRLVVDFIKWCNKNKVDYIGVASSAKNELAHKFYRNSKFKDYDLVLQLKLSKNK